MKRERIWFYSAIGVFAAVLALVGLLNYVIDPYGFFRKDFSWQFIEPNSNFIKARYVTEHPERYDCFVFGSSRVNGIDVRKIPGYRCYNMTCNGGLPRNSYDKLRYMLEKGVKPRLLFIGLDEYSFRSDPDAQLNEPMRHPYPPVLGQSSLTFYLKYLFCLHGQHIMGPAIQGFVAKIRGRSATAVQYDVLGTGLIFSPEADRKIDLDPERHKTDPRILDGSSAAGEYMKGSIEDLTKLVGLVKASGIRTIFFINPPYTTRFLECGLAEFADFKRRLAALTDYYDFSGLNSVTTDPFNYYESSHYRFRAGDLMLARMLGDRTTPVPPDFGVLVTAKNVDAHLARLSAAIGTARPAH
jgi:hypothetical protein